MIVWRNLQHCKPSRDCTLTNTESPESSHRCSGQAASRAKSGAAFERLGRWAVPDSNRRVYSNVMAVQGRLCEGLLLCSGRSSKWQLGLGLAAPC